MYDKESLSRREKIENFMGTELLEDEGRVVAGQRMPMRKRNGVSTGEEELLKQCSHDSTEASGF